MKTKLKTILKPVREYGIYRTLKVKEVKELNKCYETIKNETKILKEKNFYAFFLLLLAFLMGAFILNKTNFIS